jgi:undecaprenyl-diphosphatase
MLRKLVESGPYRRVHALVRGEAPLLAAIALISGLILGFLQIADEMGEGDMEDFDRAILYLFRDPTNVDQIIGPAWVHEMVRDLTALGSFAILGLIVAAACSYLLLSGKRGATLLVMVSVLGGTVLSTLLKMSYNRPRPDLVAMSQQFTASFPSGHAMLSAVTFLTLGALLARIAPTRRLQILSISAAIILTVIVGFSRIFMGVHYPSDVLAGWSLGAAWALLCSTVAFYLQRRGSIEKPSGQSAEGVSRSEP